ncbi:hypothetical protein JD969_16925 [Planctomycetota bacterium]|nr:hypothetical protein JD969_16925 [Planctomycetota bacterium]
MKNESVKICCDAFQWMIDSAGHSGFSIIVAGDISDVVFYLQARAYDENQENKLDNIPRTVDPPKPFCLKMQNVIQYCPFCGTSLKKIASNNSSKMELLIKLHMKYDLSMQ